MLILGQFNVMEMPAALEMGFFYILFFTFFIPLLSSLPFGNHHLILYIDGSVSVLFIQLFCSLDSTCK